MHLNKCLGVGERGSMSRNQVVPDSWEDSVFASSGESRHIEGGRPSGTSTPNQSDGEGGDCYRTRLSD